LWDEQVGSQESGGRFDGKIADAILVGRDPDFRLVELLREIGTLVGTIVGKRSSDAGFARIARALGCPAVPAWPWVPHETRAILKRLTGQIIAEMEAGRVPWVQPWGRRGRRRRSPCRRMPPPAGSIRGSTS
jgi:hypothetical protein